MTINDSYDPKKIFNEEAKASIADSKRGSTFSFWPFVAIGMLLGFVVSWPVLLLFATHWSAWIVILALLYYGLLIFAGSYAVRLVRSGWKGE